MAVIQLNRAMVLAMGIIIPLIDIVAVGLRIFARKRKSLLAIDDYLAIFALVLSIAIGAILITGAVLYGYGKESTGDDGPESEVYILTQTKKLSNAVNFIQPWVLGSIKLSVLLFYRRIFRGKAFNIVSFSVIGFVIAWFFTSFFLIIFQCGPNLTALWSSATNVSVRCLSGTKIALFVVGSDVFSDVLIIMIPLYWTWQLHMSMIRRLLVCCIFMFGAITILASVTRLIIYILVYPTHVTAVSQMNYAASIAYWTMLEVGLSIVAACLPCLGPLLSDQRREYLSQRLLSIFSRPSRTVSSDKKTIQLESVSKSRLVPNFGVGDNYGMETTAFSGSMRGHSEEDGRIIVTSDTTLHSSRAASSAV